MAVTRGNAHQGETVRLEIGFELAGTPTDPFEVRQVEIRRSDLSLITTLSGASIVHSGVGIFYVDYPISATEATDLHHDRWFATLTDGATEKQFTLDFLVLPAIAVSAPTAYLSTTEGAAYLAAGTELTDAEIDALIARATRIAETNTGQSFIPRTETRTFHGPGAPMLTIRRPILSVSRILVLGSPPGNGDCDVDLSDVRIGSGPGGATLALGNIVPRPFRSSRLYLSPRFGGGITGSYFPRGFSNIQVTGEWGSYTSPPEEIKYAVGLLVRYMGACDDPQGGEAAFDSERIAGDRDYTIRKIWNNVTQNATTGYSDVDAIFARYMAPPVVVGVI